MKTNTRIQTLLFLVSFLPALAFGQDAFPGTSGQIDPPPAPADKPSPDDLDLLFDEQLDLGSEETIADELDSSGNSGDEGSGSDSDSDVSDLDDGSPLDSDLALGEQDTISVDFPNEEIRTILRNVADLYMLNLVVPEELQGSTSIKLRDVTWRQIFNVVLDPVGFTFTEDANIIKVVSREALNFEPPVTEIFMLNYAEAASIAGTLTSMVDTQNGGRVQVDDRTNGLIVTERQSKLSSIREVINRLDKPTEQVMIETRFIEITNEDVKNIGVNWAMLRDFTVASTAGREYEDIFARDDTYDNLNETSSSNETGDVNGTPFSNTSNLSAANNLLNMVDTSNLTKTTTAVFNIEQFGFVISALKEQNDSKLVTNPTIVTLNNQEAVINIGEEFPIPNYTFNEETGNYEVTGMNYKSIGVTLKVRPSVNNAGLITMRVEPEVSTRTGEREFGGASSASVPIISTRKTQTQVALKDGYTMGIGGLTQSNDLIDASHVPVLGKIPGLKKIFSHESTEERQTNLLIFITAKILASEDSDFEDVFTQEQMEKAGVSLDEMMHR